MWVHTRPCSKDRTQRHTRRNTGLPSLVHSVVLCCRRYPFYSTTLLYTYISRFSVNPQHQQKRIIRQSCHHKFYPQPLFNFSYNRPTFAFTSESGHTLGSRRKIAHSGSHGETGAFRTGPLSLPSTRCCTFTNIPGPGIRTAHFAAFGSWPGVRQKDAESLRDSDALMRVAVPRRRGPAGLRDPVAVPLTALIGFTILLSRIVAHRKLSACSLVTAVRFWNRCSRRSMRGTCPLEQQSDCRF